MTSVNISIRKDLYEKLSQLKQKNQSFSDFIENLLNEGAKGSFSRLMKYFGIWSDMPEEIDSKIAKFREELNENVQDRIVKWAGEEPE